MPLQYTNLDELESAVDTLEQNGQKVQQVVLAGGRWAILYSKGPGRPPKETR
jgi:hypothetical protein